MATNTISKSESSKYDVSNGTTTIYTGASVIKGVYVNTAIATDTVILGDDTTNLIVLPVGLVAGTMINLPDVFCATSIKLTRSTTATGDITVFYAIDRD